jgi:2-polyprenyl-6-methoxyphenol hydroxylase-like FAD-dependent oxidoreductase
MRILIVGAGVAGLTLAGALSAAGHEVVVMEREDALPTEGYMLDFFGPGFDAAERMGFLPALYEIHYPIGHFIFVDAEGRVGADLSYAQLRRAIFRNRHLNFMRGDLVRVLHDRLEGRVQIRFGIRPRALNPEGDAATVVTSEGDVESYDLVVGADGVHSRIRDLAFLSSEAVTVPLHCHTAAYVVNGRISALSADAFSSMSAPGITAAAYPRGWVLDQLLDAFPREETSTSTTSFRWTRPGGQRAASSCWETPRGASLCSPDKGPLSPSTARTCSRKSLHERTTEWRARSVATRPACDRGCSSGRTPASAASRGFSPKQAREEVARRPDGRRGQEPACSTDRPFHRG